MHPILVHIGNWPITWYGVMMVAGFMAGYINWIWLGRKEGRDPNAISDLLFWVMLAGIVGARAAYVVSEWSYFSAHPGRILRVDEGGLIFYGGVVGALAAVLSFARLRKERLLDLLDFAVTSLPIGHAFGRVGCFLNGCCFGKTTSCSCGVRFPYGSLCWFSQRNMHLISDQSLLTLPVYPVQLYESFVNVLIYILLIWIYRRRKREGLALSAYLMTYPVLRFILELLRGDERQTLSWLFGLNVAQGVSLLLFLLGFMLAGYSKWKGAPVIHNTAPQK